MAARIRTIVQERLYHCWMPSSGARLAASVVSFLAAVLVHAAEGPARRMEIDTPRTTLEGNTFIAPVGWRLTVRGPATILEPPEGGSAIAIVDLRERDADAAIASSWKAYGKEVGWPLKVTTELGYEHGWSEMKAYKYQTSPNEKRTVVALARKANDVWTVTINDMDKALEEKRAPQIALVLGRLLPRGYERESFAGRKARELGPEQLAELGRFVQDGLKELRIPGASIGIIEGGKVVLADGYGVKDLDEKGKPDADTQFLAGLNINALASLVLAKLVEEGKLSWDTPVKDLLPRFELGDADTTSRVLVKHLLCGCTGMPQQHFEYVLEQEAMTPNGILASLARTQPTTKFGEVYQYSNHMALVAAFVGGHVSFPDMELGAAAKKVMETRVFGPLGMRRTAVESDPAAAGNRAKPHASSIDGVPARAGGHINGSAALVGPASASWSSVRQLLRYVQMELDGGMLPDGERYIAAKLLRDRRAPQVFIGPDVSQGLGLQVDTTYGKQVVLQETGMGAFHSAMMWLPENGVGAVILTNGEPGWILNTQFRRKLLEVLFDGRNEAAAAMTTQARSFYEERAAERKLLTVPPDAEAAAKLSSRYTNETLGTLDVAHKGVETLFDFGEWRTSVGSRKNRDGSLSFVSLDPGAIGYEFVVGKGETPTLILHDAQRDYVFRSAPEFAEIERLPVRDDRHVPQPTAAVVPARTEERSEASVLAYP
ncbi:MAG: serine hydrolase domain-containing protein [Acidobacteriota bacterium]